MTDLYGQGSYDVRLDWGPAGAEAAAADISVVVDVLSFSTSVTIAVERGMVVYPYRWKDHRAREFAAQRDAVLAVGRLEAGRGGAVSAPSLSPRALLECAPVARLVLPSPNGSTIAAALDHSGSTVVAGCLRNARSVAEWVRSARRPGRAIAVIAAGERWESDASLRPALEDLLGAGAIVSHLCSAGGVGSVSPEAEAAAMAFDTAAGHLSDMMHACVGGRELAVRGYGADVHVAAELNASQAVPVLRDGAFVAA